MRSRSKEEAKMIMRIFGEEKLGTLLNIKFNFL